MRTLLFCLMITFVPCLLFPLQAVSLASVEVEKPSLIKASDDEARKFLQATSLGEITTDKGSHLLAGIHFFDRLAYGESLFREPGFEKSLPLKAISFISKQCQGRAVRRIDPFVPSSHSINANRMDMFGRQARIIYCGDDAISLQERLLLEGLVLVYPTHVWDKATLGGLYRAEEKARKAQKGLWAQWKVVKGQDVEKNYQDEVGKFIMIEGEVLAVASRSKYTYINFGADWKEDVSAAISASHVKQFDAGFLEDLKGKNIRIRGWLEDYNGPYIRLNAPGQIEIVE